MSALFISLAFQLIVIQVISTCPISAIVVQNIEGITGSLTHSYGLSSTFSSVSPTETFHAITIGFWVQSESTLTDFVQFNGDGNQKRFSLDFILGVTGIIMGKIVTDLTTLSATQMTADPNDNLQYWNYMSAAVNYQTGSFYLYIWNTGAEEVSNENNAINFATTDDWALTTTGSKIILCIIPSQCGNYQLSTLTVFLGAYLKNAGQFQRLSNQNTPLGILIFYSDQYAVEQATGTNLSLTVSFAPSYDTSTDSLNFPENGRHLKWTAGRIFADPLRMVTILMRLSFNLGTDCGYQKLISRKTSAGTELYSFGFSSSIAPGSLIFSYTWNSNYRAAVPGSSIFNNNYFHTIIISTFISDTEDRFIFTVSVNGSVPTTNPSLYQSGITSQSYAESTTDQFWLGDDVCSFQGKLEYFYLWNNGGLDNQMNCLPGCSFSVGTLTDHINCLNVCHSSCLTCTGNLNTDCLSCQPSRLQYNPSNSSTFRCILSCPTGFFPSQGNTECLRCDNSCLSCTNGTACDQCNNHYPVKVGPSASLCYSDCPPMTYLEMGRCLDCNDSCSNCSGSSSQECTSCNTSCYLDLVSPTANSGSCVNCDPSCNTCVGSTGNDCISCNPPLILNGSSCQINSTSTPNINNTTIHIATDDSALQIAITASSTILEAMSYVPTAAVLATQFAAQAGTTSFTSGISTYNLYSYMALIKIASLLVLINVPYRQKVLDFFKATIATQSFPNFFSPIVGDRAANLYKNNAFSRITIASQFLLNYGSYMSQQLSFLLMAVFFQILTCILRKYPRVSVVLGKIGSALYNNAIIYMTGSEIPFLIGVVVTFHSGHYKDSSEDIFGLVLMILMKCIWLGFFSLIAILLFKGEGLKEPNKERGREISNNLHLNRVSLKKILVEGLLERFNSAQLHKQLALPLKFIKILCIALLFGMSQSYPLLQIIPAIILQAGWLILDAWSDPKKKKADLVINLLENLLVLMGFISCLFISVFKEVEAFDFVLIGVISSAFIIRTLYLLIGTITAVLQSLCSKKDSIKNSHKTRLKTDSKRIFKKGFHKQRARRMHLKQRNKPNSSGSDSFLELSPESVKKNQVIRKPKILVQPNISRINLSDGRY